MTSLEYLLKLLGTSAEALGVPFVKTTPTRLQSWTVENEPPFIALVGVSESNSKIQGSNNLLPSFDLAFVSIVASELDPTDEQITLQQIEADKLIKSFRFLIDKNEYASIDSFSLEELFRDGSYLGTGKGFTMTLTLPDLNDYCDLSCNTSTNKIEC
jgi:hypothetical protein